MQFHGVVYAPKSSERHQGILDVAYQQDAICLHVADQAFRCELGEVEISSAVAQLPVRFKLPNGWLFVCARTEPLEKWLKGRSRPNGIVWLESNYLACLLSVMLCIAVIVSGYVYALPWASNKVANMIPDSLSIVLGEQVLQTLDQNWQPSTLTMAEQEQIRQRLSTHLSHFPALPFPVHIEFRSSQLGANAFALPGGKIVLLDDLVNLANNQAQLDSVIFHELGHIYHRHMLKQLAHSSLLSISVALMTGESSGIVDNLAGITVFALSSGYSRQAEAQADAYARKAMILRYGGSEAMAEMFELLAQQTDEFTPLWLSTHEAMQTRIEAAKKSLSNN